MFITGFSEAEFPLSSWAYADLIRKTVVLFFDRRLRIVLTSTKEKQFEALLIGDDFSRIFKTDGLGLGMSRENMDTCFALNRALRDKDAPKVDITKYPWSLEYPDGKMPLCELLYRPADLYFFDFVPIIEKDSIDFAKSKIDAAIKVMEEAKEDPKIQTVAI